MVYLPDNEISSRFPGEGRPAMVLVIVLLAAVVSAGSIWADYRWRRWMAERRQDRDRRL